MTKLRTWLSLRLFALARKISPTSCWVWPKSNGAVTAGVDITERGLAVIVTHYDEWGNVSTKSHTFVKPGDLVELGKP